MIGGNSAIMPTSVTIIENSRGDDDGSNDAADDRMAAEVASNSLRGSASPIAFGVGRIEDPARTNSGSPK